MGLPVTFTGCNRWLMPPLGKDGAPRGDIAPMHSFNNGTVTVQRWLLTQAELDEVRRTGCVFVAVIMGETAPPLFVGNYESARALTADYGAVWHGELDDFEIGGDGGGDV